MNTRQHSETVIDLADQSILRCGCL